MKLVLYMHETLQSKHLVYHDVDFLNISIIAIMIQTKVNDFGQNKTICDVVQRIYES